MSKLTKISTIVGMLLMLSVGTTHARELKNPTFKKVRKTLWYMGVNGPSLEEVELQIEDESEQLKGQKKLPEELLKAMKKARGL